MIHSPEVIEVLETTPLFLGVARDLLFDKLSQSKLRTLKSGEVLLIPGHSNNKIYIILTGRLNIQSKLSSIEPLAVLGEGESVGEMSVLGGAPVSAYAIAATDCRLLAIEYAALWDLIDNSHEAAHNMLNILTERIRNINQIIAESLEKEQGFSGS